MQQQANTTDQYRFAFERVYNKRIWEQGSGPGSRPESTVAYRDLIESLLRKYSVRRVLDLGCGDWEFSRLIDWSNVEYLGIDIVENLITRNNYLFSNPSVRFECADIRVITPPEGDLYIVKDVFQHWPTQHIIDFLHRLDGHRTLITNTQRQGSLSTNRDIGPGDYRPLDLLSRPFNLRNAQIVTEYDVGRDDDHKQVLLTEA